MEITIFTICFRILKTRTIIVLTRTRPYTADTETTGERNGRRRSVTIAVAREFADRRRFDPPPVRAVARDRVTCARIRIPDTRYPVAVIVVIAVIDCAADRE